MCAQNPTVLSQLCDDFPEYVRICGLEGQDWNERQKVSGTWFFSAYRGELSSSDRSILVSFSFLVYPPVGNNGGVVIVQLHH